MSELRFACMDFEEEEELQCYEIDSLLQSFVQRMRLNINIC